MHSHRSARNGKGSFTYISWRSMIRRCYGINYMNYKSYGGRGISVCVRWWKFENFLKDLNERPKQSMTLDRINPNKGYYPENSRWASRKTQDSNKSH